VKKCIGKQEVPRRIKGSLVVPLSLGWFLLAAYLLAFLWPSILSSICLLSGGFDHRFLLDCLPCS